MLNYLYLFIDQPSSVTILYEWAILLLSIETGLDRSKIMRAFEVNIIADIVPCDTKAGGIWTVNLPKCQFEERINPTLRKNIEADIIAVPELALKKR